MAKYQVVDADTGVELVPTGAWDDLTAWGNKNPYQYTVRNERIRIGEQVINRIFVRDIRLDGAAKQ